MFFCIFTVSINIRDNICNAFDLYIFILLFSLFPTFILHDLIQNSLRFLKEDIFKSCKKNIQNHVERCDATYFLIRKDKEYMVDITVSDSQDIFKIKKAIED